MPARKKGAHFAVFATHVTRVIVILHFDILSLWVSIRVGEYREWIVLSNKFTLRNPETYAHCEKEQTHLPTYALGTQN